MATVNIKYESSIVDVGSIGRFSDGGYRQNTEFGHRLRNKTLTISSPAVVTNTTLFLPYVFV